MAKAVRIGIGRSTPEWSRPSYTPANSLLNQHSNQHCGEAPNQWTDHCGRPIAPGKRLRKIVVPKSASVPTPASTRQARSKNFYQLTQTAKRSAAAALIRLTRKPPEPDVVHQPQHHKYRKQFRAARNSSAARESPSPAYCPPPCPHSPAHGTTTASPRPCRCTFPPGPAPSARSARSASTAKNTTRAPPPPHEPMLLGKRRENEIGVRNRQKPELSLGAVRHAPPPHPAVPDRDLGLDHLIARAREDRAKDRRNVRSAAPSDNP